MPEEVEDTEDPLQQVASEGLTLIRSQDNRTGWKGVRQSGKRFAVEIYDGEAKTARRLRGTFATAEQVAFEW